MITRTCYLQCLLGSLASEREEEAGDEARDEAGDEAGECRTGETLLDLAKDSAKIAISEISGFFMFFLI